MYVILEHIFDSCGTQKCQFALQFLISHANQLEIVTHHVKLFVGKNERSETLLCIFFNVVKGLIESWVVLVSN